MGCDRRRSDRAAGVLRVPAPELPLPGRAQRAQPVRGADGARAPPASSPPTPRRRSRASRALPHRLQTVLEDGTASRGWTTASRPRRSRRWRRSRAFPGARSCCSAAARTAGRTTASWDASWPRGEAVVIGVPSTGPRLLARRRGRRACPRSARCVAEDLAAAVALARSARGPGRRRAALAGRAELRPLPRLRGARRALRRARAGRRRA